MCQEVTQANRIYYHFLNPLEGAKIIFCWGKIGPSLWAFFIFCHRLLEPRPSLPTTVHNYSGPADGHRGVRLFWDASRVLPLPAGWLETGDPGNVWSTEDQGEGKDGSSGSSVMTYIGMYLLKEKELGSSLQLYLQVSLLFLPSGAAIVGGGADPSCTAAEVPGGGVEEARAGTSRARDPHPWERAQHHHSPAVPGKASRGEQAGQVPPQSP